MRLFRLQFFILSENLLHTHTFMRSLTVFVFFAFKAENIYGER